jgi:hypothetical protein
MNFKFQSSEMTPCGLVYSTGSPEELGCLHFQSSSRNLARQDRKINLEFRVSRCLNL